MERLSAEYLTLATLAQAERWDALLARVRAHRAELAPSGPARHTVRSWRHSVKPKPEASTSRPPSPSLVAGRSLADAADVAAVLHGRVERWTQAAGGRRRRADNLIAGLIPRAQGVTDPEMAQALAERDRAMEERARHAGRPSDRDRRRLGATSRACAGRPGADEHAGCAKSRRSPPTGTAGTSPSKASIGGKSDVASTEQMSQRKRALAAAERAAAIGHDAHVKRGRIPPGKRR